MVGLPPLMNPTSPADHPYAPFVHLVQKPARYLGGEFGARKKEWSAVRSRICLAFPDVYDIGMSHLGFKILYGILNDHPETLAERCYAPWVDMEAQLRTRGLPLVSLESAKPLREFDVVGFSLQFELTYTNVLTMLDLGGVPLRGAARGEDDPLVLAGGPTATHPEPLAPFLDAVVIGDGEERTAAVALLWADLKAKGVPRAQRLQALASLQGVYVPALYVTALQDDTGLHVVTGTTADGVPVPVRRSVVPDLNAYPFPDDGPVGGPEAIFDRMSIEIARGCTEGCRFCQAGMIYRPVRERDPEQVIETLVSAVKKAGYDEASLTSLSTADYSCIAPLVNKVVNRLAPEKISLGVSSLRAYGLEENVLDDLQRVRATGVTFAPEAGSQRMRDVINKNVTEEQLMTTAERVFSRGWSAMKLYFMIGLPTEEEADVREIAKVGGRARQVGKKVKSDLGTPGAPKITVSVSTHVPKPHTPFQWCAMDPPAQIHEKQRWLEEEARAAKVDLRMHDCDTSWLEAVFARGDRPLADVLEHAYRAGARFDSWEDQKRMDLWEAAFRAHGVDVAKYLGTLPVSARLPWDHLDVGLEEGFLAREYRKALKSRLSPPCGKVAGAFVHATNLEDAHKERKKLVCYDCGVACDLGAMREERLVYLSRLGAEKPRPPAIRPARPLPVVSDDGTSSPRTPKRAVPPKITQGEPRRYRFAYTKLGSAAFLSHLDLLRALPRAFRRLGLPLFYSQGFHPKPDLVFGPALSLGVASLAEYVDVKITADVDAAALLRDLSASSPDGLRFTAGTRLAPGTPSLGKLIEAARYAVAIPRKVLDEAHGGDGVAWLEAQAQALVSAKEARVLRRIDGVGKWVDVRDYLHRLEVNDEGSREALAAAGLVGDLVSVGVDVHVRGSGAVKIAEVMEALLREPEGPATSRSELPHRALRVALGRLQAGGRIASPVEISHEMTDPSVQITA